MFGAIGNGIRNIANRIRNFFRGGARPGGAAPRSRGGGGGGGADHG